MACEHCKDYIGRCGHCGADLRKATESEPIGKPVLPPRPKRRPVEVDDAEDDPLVSRR